MSIPLIGMGISLDGDPGAGERRGLLLLGVITALRFATAKIYRGYQLCISGELFTRAVVAIRARLRNRRRHRVTL